MGRRFTDRQLFEVRNHIPIRSVIEGLLDMPAKTVEGVFRFLCPRCREFETALNPQTNLARCFRCEKNFNPIDMVMAVRRTDFVETVGLLIQFKEAGSSDEGSSSRPDKCPTDINRPPNAGKPGSSPVAIGDILSRITAGITIDDIGEFNESTRAIVQPLSEDDIADPEHIVDLLSQMIQRFKSGFHKKA